MSKDELIEEIDELATVANENGFDEAYYVLVSLYAVMQSGLEDVLVAYVKQCNDDILKLSKENTSYKLN